MHPSAAMDHRRRRPPDLARHGVSDRADNGRSQTSSSPPRYGVASCASAGRCASGNRCERPFSGRVLRGDLPAHDGRPHSRQGEEHVAISDSRSARSGVTSSRDGAHQVLVRHGIEQLGRRRAAQRAAVARTMVELDGEVRVDRRQRRQGAADQVLAQPLPDTGSRSVAGIATVTPRPARRGSAPRTPPGWAQAALRDRHDAVDQCGLLTLIQAAPDDGEAGRDRCPGRNPPVTADPQR